MAELKRQSTKNADQWVEVASSIGRGIVRDAIWHGERCSWIGAMPEERPGGGIAMAYQALGPDLYGGTAGVGLFLAELARATDDADVRRAALGALRHAASRADDLSTATQSGLYAGPHGIAIVLARSSRVLADEELDSTARRLTAALPAPVDGEFDLLSGSAGAIVGFLTLHSLLGNGGLVARATVEGDRLLAVAQRQDAGLAWPSRLPPNSRPLTGFSHGTAGAATALLELSAATGDERYAAAARAAFTYERSLYDPERRNWPDLRESVDGPTTPGSSFATFWCHGAPGIALSRLRALELGEDWARDEASVALETTADWIEAALDAQLNYSLCHGLAGNAEVVGEGRKLLGERGWRTLAEVAARGADLYGRESVWPSGAHGGPTPSLFLGDAGVGRFYLRVADPGLPTVLLVRPEAFADG